MWRLKNSNFQNSQVVHMMKLLILIQNPQIDSKVVMDDAPSYQKRKSLNAWFLWRQSIETPPSAHDRIRIEFSLYKSEAPTHLQKNVHQTKYHLRIAKFYLRILATSVSSERAFLAAGKIVCAQRASLRGDNVEMLIFLISNLRVFSNLCKKKSTWIWQILCKSKLKNHSDEWLFDKTLFFLLYLSFLHDTYSVYWIIW